MHLLNKLEEVSSAPPSEAVKLEWLKDACYKDQVLGSHLGFQETIAVQRVSLGGTALTFREYFDGLLTQALGHDLCDPPPGRGPRKNGLCKVNKSRQK